MLCSRILSTRNLFLQLESVAPISRCHYYFTFGYIYSRFRVTEILLPCFIILVSDFCYFPKLSICIEMPVFLSFDLSTICQNLVCQFELSMLDVSKETLGEIYLDGCSFSLIKPLFILGYNYRKVQAF